MRAAKTLEGIWGALCAPQASGCTRIYQRGGTGTADGACGNAGRGRWDANPAAGTAPVTEAEAEVQGALRAPPAFGALEAEARRRKRTRAHLSCT